MDSSIAKRLLTLNRIFYGTFAEPFARSRSPSDPALAAILPHIPACAKVLDAGCGDGRLAVLLAAERPGVTYVGVDVVPELVALAQRQAAALEAIATRFHVCDVSQPGWSRCLCVDDCEPRFDVAVALAILHHIPGLDRRVALLRELASLVSCRGCLVVSTWQFLDSARLRRKIVDWRAADISPDAVEPGDYLLDWKRGGTGLRYVHLVDAEEMSRLAAASGLSVEETFRAGGREGNLSLFAILKPAAQG
jgi:2-polyprenyl-3-methyl-5-hydroxy-6-metoxy-1,4-benzoquinol methylase